MKRVTKSIASPTILVGMVFLLSWRAIEAANVTYDHRSLTIGNRRQLIISAAIHYPRSVPAMWPSLVQTAKEGGCNAIESYVFWNGHEPSPGKYYFGGRYNLVKFIKIVQQAGMHMILRIGPFVAAEWNYGGVPVWLHYVPGTVFRTDNEPWKHYMESFTTYIVNLLKTEKLFAPQGGPIILSQVENEYGYYEGDYGEGGKRYAQWSASMAVSQNIGVPWMMCQQWDAPPTVISTCNGFYCDQFTPNTPDKPKIWTENWPGWFKTFGGRDPHRPAEDVAYSVARFFGKGGSVHNYYMYHGGTNFGRTSGGPFITTSYDYEAPIDEYGLPRLPKWGHLKNLHKAIMLSENLLISGEHQNFTLGHSLEADVYTDSSGTCAAFLSNLDDKNDKTVMFRNTSYHLPAWSVSILPDCKNEVFNTAKVTSKSSKVEMSPEDLKSSSGLKWEVFLEKPGIWGEADFVKNELVDHINTTKDTTDYLWYTTSIKVSDNEDFLKKGSSPVLFIESKGHTLHVFINKEYLGTATGNGTHVPFKLKKSVSLKACKNNIDLLSMTVGLSNAGSFYEWVGAGLTSVSIKGFNKGTLNLTNSKWSYKLGVQGEHLELFKPGNSGAVKWMVTTRPPKKQPLTWYKVVIDPPSGSEPVGLDMISMGKGMAWLNGEEIGRYWPRVARKNSPNDECVKECDYRGKFMPDKCLTGCGEPSQRWLGLYCYNFQKGTNLKFVRWEKYNTEYTCDLDYYITLEAMDPACNSVFSFQILFSEAGYTTADTFDIVTWRILACRPRCNKPVDDYWDWDEEMDKCYTSPMPKWFSDEALASDKKKYYVVQESEVHENDWLHLFMEIAFFSRTSFELVAPPPLEINMVVVETKEDYITEAREKLQAENAIFYISYKYRGVSSSGFAGDHKAIIRKTMDGKPGHMNLEVAYEPEEEEEE